MSLTIMNYKATFLPASTIGDFQIKTVQAADADTMEQQIAAAIADIVALNATATTLTGLDSPPYPADFTNGNKLVLADATLAGGGDGHTFIATLQFVRFAMASNTLLNQFLAGFLPSVNDAGTQVLAYDGTGGNNTGVINTGMNSWFTDFFDPSLLQFKACLASTAQELNVAQQGMIARLIAAFPNLNGVLTAPYQAVAGAAKGTRFMAICGGYQT